jgi:sugar lactone lactonase YvrE
MKAREESPRLRRAGLQLIGVGILALLCWGGTPAGAVAAEVPAFNPVLSLTGDCSVSALDPVPDPGCPGGEHPANHLETPTAVTTDFYGDIYVSSPSIEVGGPKARIDVFDSSGHFITEITDESGPGALAVDSKGYLYVSNRTGASEEGLVRYKPTHYEPAAGEIEYGNPPTALLKTEGFENGLAINPQNDHLFRKSGGQITEYKSAVEGNEEIGSFGGGQLKEEPVGIAVDATHNRIYVTTWQGEPITKVVKVFELAAPHNLQPCTVEEADVPGGKLQSSYFSVAADEGSGHFYLYDGVAKKVYEFGLNCEYLATIEHGFQYTFLTQIAVDNGANSPNGGLLAPGEPHYLFVPSNLSGVGHSYAFGPRNVGAPEIESASFSNVSETEAELEASIVPGGLETHYTFKYLSEEQWEGAGKSIAGAQVAGEGEIPAGTTPINVAAAAEGLTPGTTYRFRVIAENEEGSDEAEGRFATYAAAEAFLSCPNEALRGGPSALLPDCRAYELVTPPDTDARSPLGFTHNGSFFATRKASPSGGALSFVIEGGLIPGSEGTGSLFGDPYLSTRGEGGWSTELAGPSGAESGALKPGSNSPDQGYSFWETGGPRGTAVITEPTTYVRYPDGHSALVGRGSLADDPQAQGELISEGGTHIIFWIQKGLEHPDPPIQLEPNAPPSGTAAIYDRTADEVTHVVSLLPGNKTPKAGENATYVGASLDGRGVAFKIGTKLYLRHNDQETYEVGEGVTFAGIAEGGSRVFYLEGGRLWRLDAATGERTAFSTETVTPVNVSADGSTAYFVSTAKLTPGANPNGEKAATGKENLYRSLEGTIGFVGIVTERDVKGESTGNEQIEGLGLWTKAVTPTPEGLAGRFAIDPSRTTPDGNALLFESRAALNGKGGYDPQGHAEVYRYDAAANELECISCNPTLVPASSNASLQSISRQGFDPEPLTSYGLAGNLRADGRRAFFQSDEALVPADVDGLQDVYEWEAQGVGSCNRPTGCIYLVSSGHSLRTDYLYGSSDSGDDVFFRTGDLLLPRDAEETPSIYDARVGGGFAEPAGEECQGEGCRPGVSPAPVTPNLGSRINGPSGNVQTNKHCPKSKRKARRHGKTVCVKKKHHAKHKHHRKAGKNKGAGK